MSEKSFISQDDLILTDDEMNELRTRSLTDRISLVCYNNMKTGSENPFMELYQTLTILIKTEITNKLKDKTFVLQKDAFSSSLLGLFDSLPRMAKGMEDIKTMAYGKNVVNDSDSKSDSSTLVTTETLAVKYKDKK